MRCLDFRARFARGTVSAVKAGCYAVNFTSVNSFSMITGFARPTRCVAADEEFSVSFYAGDASLSFEPMKVTNSNAPEIGNLSQLSVDGRLGNSGSFALPASGYVSVGLSFGFETESLSVGQFQDQGDRYLLLPGASNSLSSLTLHKDGRFSLTTKDFSSTFIDRRTSGYGIGIVVGNKVFGGNLGYVSQPENGIFSLSMSQGRSIGSQPALTVFFKHRPMGHFEYETDVVMNGHPVMMDQTSEGFLAGVGGRVESGQNVVQARVFKVHRPTVGILRDRMSSLATERTALQQEARSEPNRSRRQRLFDRIVVVESEMRETNVLLTAERHPEGEPASLVFEGGSQ